MYIVLQMEFVNSVDPDQTPHAASDQDLLCL